MSINGFNLFNFPEFDDHRVVAFTNDNKTGLWAIIAIHRGGLARPAFGATRMWAYPSELDAIRDALKLSRVMTYKSALAGLNYGGAKAIILKSQTSKNRQALIETYARYVNYLNGHFVTGADVGLTAQDVKIMSLYSPHMVGLKTDPVKYTVLGVLNSMKLCSNELFGTPSLSQRSFAIQGLGKTGMGLLQKIYPVAKEVYVSDVDQKKVKAAVNLSFNIKGVESSEIYKQKVDVFVPCALSNAINFKNISKLKCRMIVGSANCQLESEQIGELLYKLGILYAPDYVVNAGGLITVVDEYEHKDYDQDRLIERIYKIELSLKTIISKSKTHKKATNIIANEMAEKIISKLV